MKNWKSSLEVQSSHISANMKNPELYNKTVDILVQAYLKDTLEHQDPCACAVGNIIASNNSTKEPFSWVENRNPDGEGSWYTQIVVFESNKLSPGVALQVANTGYSPKELRLIEHAFESASREGDWMFNGLMDVVAVLDKIHENTNEVITRQTKRKFELAKK